MTSETYSPSSWHSGRGAERWSKLPPQEGSDQSIESVQAEPPVAARPADVPGAEITPASAWAAALESTECAPTASVPRVRTERTTVEQRQWASGQRVGRYQLERLIGRGACGEVWSARDPLLGRLVAVKLPRSNRIKQCPWLPHTIWSEARVAARAASLNCCVPIYDFGWDDGSTVYIVMQLMEVSVAQLIANGPIGVRPACRLIRSVSRRLHRAHLEGLVHCDLKPSNLLLDTNGELYPSDFSTTMPRALLATESELFVGTLPYMAPEQLEGRAFDYDCRTDCYALGVVLYEMITGHRPFRAETPEELVRTIRSADLRPLYDVVPTVPRELDAIVRSALAYYRHQRPPDVRTFGRAVWRVARSSC